MFKFAVSLLMALGAFAALPACPNPTKDTCLRGGQKQYPCTGPNCAPCWIHQDDENWGCYELLRGEDGELACPFPNMVNIKDLPSTCKPSVCPDLETDVCYRGNMDSSPCLDDCCPRCWIKSGSKWACFDAIDGECEKWPGMIDTENPPVNCPIF
ncbi:hypothetical protein DSO57_1013141 [Entomophthora muscae]|uniref:Uncharacterized protein n=2 Tax=Entomophthora muscae TaxID=34485 RepID=A0ACC2SQ39_9FUNG|nr:hypothetical protein DSO57_1029551 [Entomophthora muscae]KAJ9073715.1 hypothetical protein DSO57_1013141 [Entomophthora muscae]